MEKMRNKMQYILGKFRISAHYDMEPYSITMAVGNLGWHVSLSAPPKIHSRGHGFVLAKWQRILGKWRKILS
jgi:hypothetical protein